METGEANALQYTLRSLGIPVKGGRALCGNNQGMIISCTNPDSELKKKHVAISYHKLRESAAARIVNPLKVCTTVNDLTSLLKVCRQVRLVVFPMNHMELTG